MNEYQYLYELLYKGVKSLPLDLAYSIPYDLRTDKLMGTFPGTSQEVTINKN